MNLRDYGRIRDTPSGTHLISGDNKDQYIKISWSKTKPQATIPQENSRRVNYMPGINNYITIYALD